MDDVTALRDALVRLLDTTERIHGAAQSGNTGHDLRCNRDDCYVIDEMEVARTAIAAVEARAALTPERLAKALVATTIFAGHATDCPVWMNRMIELRGERVDLDTCTCWVKDEAPDRARRILAALSRPEEPRVERCAVCGVGRWVTAHDPEAGPSYHPFTPEALLVRALRVVEAAEAVLAEQFCPASGGGTEGKWCLNHDTPMVDDQTCSMVAALRAALGDDR